MKLTHSTHTFELLTPAWAGGAIPETTAEIRVPTIRGHLRQWLRILYPNQDLDNAIFGAVGNEDQIRSSRVQLRLEKPVSSASPKNLASYTGRTERDALSDPESYFLWPLRTQSRSVIMPGPSSQFTLQVRWYPLPGNPTDTHMAALDHALTAFSLLGSIGTRATRGYGSVWNPSSIFASEGDLADALEFLPQTVSVRLLPEPYDDGRKALAGAARWMRSFRVGSANYGDTTPEAVNDHDVADPAQAARRNAVVYRHALGMPLAQRFNRGQGNTTTVQSKYGPANNQTDRYPSPLRIKIVKLAGKYRILIVLLRDLLLPEGTAIVLSNHRHAQLSHVLVDQMMLSGLAIR